MEIALQLGLLMAAPIVEAANDPSQKLYAEGFELLKAGKPRDAAQKFQKGMEADPDGDRALPGFYMAESYLAQGQRESAKVWYEISLMADEKSQVAPLARKRLEKLKEFSGGSVAAAGSAPIGSPAVEKSTAGEASWIWLHCTYVISSVRIDGQSLPDEQGDRFIVVSIDDSLAAWYSETEHTLTWFPVTVSEATVSVKTEGYDFRIDRRSMSYEHNFLHYPPPAERAFNGSCEKAKPQELARKQF